MDDFLTYAFPRTPLLDDDLLDAGEKLVVYGESESGKSYLVMQLALDLATCGSFLGFDVIRKCRVGILQAELSEFRYQERMRKLAYTYDLLGVEIAIVTTEEIKLDTRSGMEWYADWVADVRPDVVIIDPMRAFFAGSENDSDSVERWFYGLALAHRDVRPTLTWVHHVSKGGPGFGYVAGSKASARGSGVITDRPSTSIGLVVNEAQSEWELHFTKTRNRYRHPDTLKLSVNANSGLFEIHEDLDATTSYVLMVMDALRDGERTQPDVLKELSTRTGAAERTVRDWVTKAEQRGKLQRKRVGAGPTAPYVLVPLDLTKNEGSDKV